MGSNTNELILNQRNYYAQNVFKFSQPQMQIQIHVCTNRVIQEFRYFDKII